MVRKKILDAIVLSSTFGEEIEFIVNFLDSVILNCSKIKEYYLVQPVLVFELKEKEKCRKIREIFSKKDFPIKPLLLINKNSRGFPACLNYGIANTNSEFILRLDTDDRLEEDRIKKQLDFMKKFSLDMSSGNMNDLSGKELRYPTNRFGLSLVTALGACPIAHPSICIRRYIFNPYNEKLNRCEDVELWIRLFISEGFKWRGLDSSLTKYSIKRASEKSGENALYQIKIRASYSLRLIFASFILILGIFPNLIRIFDSNNLLLNLRRRF
ncbi:glycosyltransferase [Prochlorococcus sp. AH-716-J09]|nr:glycosyltransferase [Prochlorococcus sp. AH-716-J09]